MNLKLKITTLYFGSQEMLTAAHMPVGTLYIIVSHLFLISVAMLEKSWFSTW